MAFPIKICALCSEEFELRPDKPGFATHCPECTAEESAKESAKSGKAEQVKTDSEQNQARRQAIRDLLYRKDS